MAMITGNTVFSHSSNDERERLLFRCSLEEEGGTRAEGKRGGGKEINFHVIFVLVMVARCIHS